MLLESYIDKFGAPKNVIVVHVYDVWYREAALGTIAQAPWWAIWQNKKSAAFDTGQKIQIALAKLFPTYFNDKTLPRLALKPYKIRLARSPGKIARSVFMPPRETGNGFQGVANANPATVLRDLKGHKVFVAEQEFTLSEQNRDALLRIGKLAEIHGFDVYLAPGPLYSGLYEHPDFVRYYAAEIEILSRVIQDKPRIHRVQSGPMTFEVEQLELVDHVTGEGARVYTEWLVSQIEATAASSNAAGGE